VISLLLKKGRKNLPLTRVVCRNTREKLITFGQQRRYLTGIEEDFRMFAEITHKIFF
jgi:hypothetical protein